MSQMALITTLLLAMQPVTEQLDPTIMPAATAPPCVSDEAALLALSPEAFDQDLDGGWRSIAARPECQSEAADLIARYRLAAMGWQRLLAWHEGQLRALSGDSSAAIVLMRSARRPEIDEGSPNGQWNAYVDATIAFLEHDRDAIAAARSQLIAAPPQSGWTGAEPMNLTVVDKLIKCFDRSYADAYGSADCRAQE